jgi:hypothetical protein
VDWKPDCIAGFGMRRLVPKDRTEHGRAGRIADNPHGT